jgi:glycosyltransferase involved in cell wall biosynthesis
VIAGRPGWLYEDIYQRIQALHLEARVRFIKQPSPAHLVALYNGASVLILPSFYEGFGLPVLEAMQCGTPVIASNRACLPEVVGQAGLLFDPDDTAALAEGLRRILHDASLRQELIHRGLERVQRFSWETSARQTLQVYKRVVRDVSH